MIKILKTIKAYIKIKEKKHLREVLKGIWKKYYFINLETALYLYNKKITI